MNVRIVVVVVVVTVTNPQKMITVPLNCTELYNLLRFPIQNYIFFVLICFEPEKANVYCETALIQPL